MKLVFMFVSFIFLCSCAQRTLSNETSSIGSCTYETWDWDTRARKSVNHKRISKKRSELTPSEKNVDLSECTVCEEDQALIQIAGVPEFKVCSALKEKVTTAIKEALVGGFKIETVVGYRVGKSKGAVGEDGLRTAFSHHSFGTALDLNAEKNGLYDSCVRFGPGCKLIRGGEYHPGSIGAIVYQGVVYGAFIRRGFKWGGELSGKQKDFMHFSLSGF